MRFFLRIHFWSLVVVSLCSTCMVARAVRIIKDEQTQKQTQTRMPQQQHQTQEDHHRLHDARHTSRTSPVMPPDPDDHLVSTPLPLWRGKKPFSTQHWAGHLPASPKDDKYLFYWLFAPPPLSQVADTDIPLIIWLNGGPGCSSMDGLWLENGPFRLTVDPQTKKYGVISTEEEENAGGGKKYYSWHTAPAYTLYIDQPVGTGLSFTKSKTYPGNDEEVNIDFYYFLQSFFQLHSDKFTDTSASPSVVNRKVFFSGESHAGHYIPSMVNYILKQNDSQKPVDANRIVIPLAGAAIGNGWIDPVYQYAAAEAAYGLGLIGRAQWHALDEKEKECQAKLKQGKYVSNVCFTLLNQVVDNSQGSSSEYKVSTYDARISESKHASREFPMGHKVVETYLGGWPLKDSKGTMSTDVAAQVLEAIHATAAKDAGQTYLECTDPPYDALAHQDGLGVVDDVVQILEHPTKPRLLFFNGIADLICNHVGNEKLLENLPWSGKEDWTKSQRYAWIASGEAEGMVSGYMKEHENLLFLKVLNAGHMVPMDVPATALEMMQTFMSSKSFDTSLQNIDNSLEDNSCPVCPVCPACEKGAGDCTNYSSVAPSAETSSSTTAPRTEASSISTTRLVGGLVAVACLLAGLLVLVLYRFGKYRTARPQLVPQYDLELRDRPTYSDEPDSNGIS